MLRWLWRVEATRCRKAYVGISNDDSMDEMNACFERRLSNDDEDNDDDDEKKEADEKD